MADRSDKHMPQLDGVRCCAAFVVILAHVFMYRYRTIGLNGIGLYAVWLFFTLSGFLITGILLRARVRGVGKLGTVLRSFYARRFLRIMPVYYAVLLISAAIGVGVSFRQDLWWHAAYLSNWLMAIRGQFADYAAPLWSLGVEEQFYLLWPALVLLAPWRRLGYIFGATAVCGVVSRIVLTLAMPHDVNAATILYPTTSNLDPLALGALLAWSHHVAPEATELRRRWTRRGLIVGLASFAIIFALSIVHKQMHVFLVIETLTAALLSAWIVNCAADGFPAGTFGKWLLNARPIRYLGTISYCLYLVHMPVMWLVLQTGVGDALYRSKTLLAGLTFFGLAFGATVLVATISWYGFERPLQRLKRFFPYVAPDRTPTRIPAPAESQPTTS